ncbi:MAG: TetR/AcrR family transcriptional regulator [Janthinobacterium lividum]
MAATSDTPVAPRPLRADARRNREAILRAALEAFEADGVFTPLDGAAARAGVGNATLYRNFPTREDLLAAVIESGTTEALVGTDELAATMAPRAAVAEWLARLTWLLRVWHDLPSCLAGGRDDAASPVQSTCNPLLARTATFLDVAKASGDVYAEVDAGQVFELVLALSWATDRFHHDEDTARRRVALATAGLYV